MNRCFVWSLVVVGTSTLFGCTSAVRESTSSVDESTLTTAAAPPITLTGQYTPDGSVEPIGRLTVDVIDERMAGAAARLAAVRAEGAACQRVLSTTWRCTKMHEGAAVPSTSLAAIGAANTNVYASFGAVTGSPSTVSEAESMVEWSIHQLGSSSVGPFGEYRYLDLQGDLVKIILPGTSGSGLELIVKDEHHLAMWAKKHVSEGQWRWHEDMALVLLVNE
jgi:hypothetical protein